MQMKFQQNPRVEAAPLNEESILFDPTGSKFFMLNSSSAFMWEKLASPISAQVLASQLCERFEGVSIEAALADVQTTLEQLRSMDLVLIANVP